MQLGFVSAILSDLALEEVLKFAADEGFPCVELMCWPPSKAERRYAGVTHVDVTGGLIDREACGHGRPASVCRSTFRRRTSRSTRCGCARP